MSIVGGRLKYWRNALFSVSGIVNISSGGKAEN